MDNCRKPNFEHDDASLFCVLGAGVLLLGLLLGALLKESTLVWSVLGACLLVTFVLAWYARPF